MRHLFAASFAIALLCACEEPAPPANVPPQPSPPPSASVMAGPAAAAEPAGHAPKAPVPIDEFFKLKRVSAPMLTHDEKSVVYLSDEGGRPDIWIQPVQGGAAKQITRVNGFLHGFAPSPAGDALVYEADKGGDELPHIYLTNLAGDAPRDIVADYPAGRRTEFLRWSDDGKNLYFLSNARDEKYLDLVVYDVAKGRSETLWQSSGKVSFGRLARDGKRWVTIETLSDVDNNLYLVERGKADKPALLTPHEGEVQYDPKAFSKDGKTLLYTSDEAGEFAGLHAMDLGKKAAKPVAQPTWDVEDAGFSFTYRYSWVETNVDGLPKVAVTDEKTHEEVALPAAPAGGVWVPVAFSKSDRYLTANLRTDTAPTTPYVLDLKENKAILVADPLPASLTGRAMVAGESVKIPSFDAQKVPAFLYKPQGDGPFPAIIDVHGGPTAQSRRQFSPIRQYLVSKGYVVLVPNVRGSTGYGKSYTKLDNLDLGGGPLQDVVACKRWLAQNARVDARKVVVMGGSYGGYMALAAATFTPGEFAANVDFFGVSDLKSLVESFPPYWAAYATYIHKKFGDPRNPEHAKYQHDRSPLHFVDRIQRPLLVVQGDKDARVKKDQSDRMVESIKKHGTPVHYLVLQDEGHGFSRNESYLAAMKVTDRFLDRYLFNDTSVEVLPGGK